jgi:hypothetical protein
MGFTLSSRLLAAKYVAAQAAIGHLRDRTGHADEKLFIDLNRQRTARHDEAAQAVAR